MIILTSHGFFSAVKHPDAPNVTVVRSFSKESLESLWRRYLEDEPIIEHTPKEAYPYKMDVTRISWGIVVQQEAEKIDYTESSGVLAKLKTKDKAKLRYKLKEAMNAAVEEMFRQKGVSVVK